MSLRPLHALVGAALLLVVGACGDDSSGPTGVTPESTMPVQYIGTFGSTGVGLPDLGADAMGFGGSNISLAAGATPEGTKAGVAAHLSRFAGGATAQLVLASPDCTPDEVGAATDSDGDGIPNDATLTFTVANCTVYDTATGNAQLVRGVYRIRDTNDDLYGFQVTLTDFHVRNFDAASGFVSDVLYNATETGKTTAGSASYHLVLDANITQGDTGGMQAQKVKYDILESFDPSGTITDGDPLPNGAFTMSGTLDATITSFGIPTRIVVQLVTPDPMSYTSGCGGIDSGEYEMRVNGSTTEGVLIHFDSCSGYYEALGAGTL
jgi:hypothetical protein